jgi:hypothetical protein
VCLLQSKSLFNDALNTHFPDAIFVENVCKKKFDRDSISPNFQTSAASVLKGDTRGKLFAVILWSE